MVAVGRLGVDDIPHEMVTELPPVFCWIGIGLVLLHEPNVPAPSECYSVKPRGWPSPFLCARNAAIRVSISANHSPCCDFAKGIGVPLGIRS